jgi:cell wall-associated NlpC family hydrolase
LIRSVKRKRIRLRCPELHKDQPIQKASQRDERSRATNRQPGLDKGFAILIDGTRADSAVMRNLERTLDVGYKKGARRKLLVADVMTILQESRGKTSATNGTHVGLYQQSAKSGWPATREPERDANAFFNRLIASDKRDPHQSLTGLIESVQRSGQASLYGKWRDEAEKVVSNYLNHTGSSSSFTVSRKKPYEFRVQKKENYWATILRLADEVGWAVFTIKDDIHFSAQEDLFRSRSRMTIKEGDNGVDYIDYDDDDRKVTQTVAVTCRMGMWDAPLGTVVTVDDDGLPDSCQGKFLVTNLQRSYFSTAGTATLTRAQHSKPEPAPEVVTKTITSGAGSDVSGSVTLKGSTRDKILQYARSTMTSRTGFRRYSKAGATTYDPTPEAPRRSDCSQWTRAIYHHITGRDIGLNTWAQIANGRRTKHPKPGDLMFPTGGGHCEIYVGGNRTIGHGSAPIDYGKLDYWPSHFFVTFDFLDD